MRKTSVNFSRMYLMIAFFVLIGSLFYIPAAISTDTAYPDLIIKKVVLPDNFTEEKEIEIIVKILNQGDRNISSGQKIWVGLFYNYDTLLASNYTNKGLEKNKETFVNISWTPSYFNESKTNISFFVNYNYNIVEDDYSNNAWDSFIEISEKETDLKITNVDVPDFLDLNQTNSFKGIIKNNGRKTDDKVMVYFNSSEGLIDTYEIKKAVGRDKSVLFYFNWTPSNFGINNLAFRVVYKDKTYDVYEKTVIIGVQQFTWWNTSWHYRYFITVKGIGNVSKVFNFTEILENLDVASQVFENNTIRIIKYSKNGEIVDVVSDYYFNESDNFDPSNNANGTLIWNADGSSDLKYYCIYFDVKSNIGSRNLSVENEDMIRSGDAYVVSSGFASGWWASLNFPKENSYNLITAPFNISVTTSALADNVSIFMYYNNMSLNDTVYLSFNPDQTSWYYTGYTFPMEGNWTINILCRDNAGFEAKISNVSIFVGRPDLKIVNISTSAVYVNETVNVSVDVFCENASIENVSVRLCINKTDNGLEVYNETKHVDFEKNKNSIISFSWTPSNAGKYVIIASVDYNDQVNESDETNNILSKNVKAFTWPDLEVESIILPSTTIMEFNDVKVDVSIRNNAQSDASDYIVKLYIEPETQGLMKYTNEKDSKKISVDGGKKIITSLYWRNADSGRWLVGVKVLFNETKKDSDIFNNRLLSSDILVVKSYDKNKPAISNVVVDTGTGEQGENVVITANITDDTGLQIVNITITDPTGNTTENVMIRSAGYTFKYEFNETFEVGVYHYKIFVVDISYYENNNTKEGNFSIEKETVKPTISYVGVDPFVQLNEEEVSIYCIVHDNIDIQTVEAVITPPNGIPFNEYLSKESENKYVYRDIYSDFGRYTFYVLVKDTAGNFNISGNRSFWITSNIDDMDNDGMPDQWEHRYGFNPKNASDAKQDSDHDGLTNLEEYKAGTDPLKAIFAQNIGYRIKTNLAYIGVSIIFFIILLLLVFLGKRRIFL